MSDIKNQESKTSGRPPRHRRPRRRGRRLLLWLLLFAVLVVVALALLPTRRIVYGTGHVMPQETATIRPAVDGAIVKILVDSGRLVEAGTLLIHLDDRVQHAYRDEMLSQLKARQAELRQLTEAQQVQRAQRRARIERARLSLEGSGPSSSSI